MQTPPTRLLAVNLNYLGDALFTTPALADLRARFPDAIIDVLAGGPAKAMLTGNPGINELIERPPHGGSGRAAALARTLRDGRYDAVVLFQSTFSNALIAWAARVPVRVGFAQDGCGPLLTRAVPARHAGEHVVDAYTRLAHAWDDTTTHPPLGDAGRLSITVSPSDAAFAQDLLDHGEQVAPTVGLVIGATRPQKRWPEEYFAKLADKLWNAHQIRCVLLGGPAEGESAQRILDQTRAPVMSAVGQTTEKQLAALIARLSVVVSGDSGPLHIATAMNTPVVALFGSTDPAETGPWQPRAGGVPSVVLYDALPCAPCRKTPTCNGRFDCLRALTPERAFDATSELLEIPSRRLQLPVAPLTVGKTPVTSPRSLRVVPPPATRLRHRVPAVFSRPALPDPVRSIVVVTKHHYMGDTIVAVPMLRAARAVFPEARITLVTGRQAAVALEHGNFADHIEPYNPHEPDFSADALCRALQGASRPGANGYPDLCLLADRSFRSARIAWRIGARVRVGFASEYRGFLLTHRVAYKMNQPETECILDVLRAVAPEPESGPCYDSRPVLIVTSDERERGAGILAEHEAHGPVLIGVQPGANYAAKQWSPRKFASVAGALAQTGATIVLLGKGPTEAEAAQTMRQALPTGTSVVDLTDATNLRETMAVLAHLQLFIGNDTGVNHMAAALGVPTVGLFGPTSAVKWGNTGRRGVVVAAPHGDLGRLEVGPVLEATRGLLAHPEDPGPPVPQEAAR